MKEVQIPVKTVYVPVAGKYSVGHLGMDYMHAYTLFLRAAESKVTILTEDLFSNESAVNLDAPFRELEMRRIPVTIYACHHIQYWRMAKLGYFKNVKFYVLDAMSKFYGLDKLSEPDNNDCTIVDGRWILSRGITKKGKDSPYFAIEDSPKKAKVLKSGLEKLLLHTVRIEPLKKKSR
jgi:hypothetical protein